MNSDNIIPPSPVAPFTDTPTTSITMSSKTSNTEPLQLQQYSNIEQYQQEQHLRLQNEQRSKEIQTMTNKNSKEELEQYTAVKEKLVHALRLNRKKQLTLERINKYNMKLMEELKTPRVKASNCALMVIDYTEQHNDPLIPEIWGVTYDNRFKTSVNVKGSQYRQAYSPGLSSNNPKIDDLNNGGNDGCCVIM